MGQCLSIIIPVLNEQDSIGVFLDRARPCVAAALLRIGVGAEAEFLFVDDGSTDTTPQILADLAARHGDVRWLRLSRNFGKEAALAAGLAYAAGDAVIPMDVDLQDPPELIVDMVRLWRGGAKIVNARRTDRASDDMVKRWSARAFYALMNRVSDDPIHPDVGDFRLLDRAAVDVINQLGERARFNKGLFAWVGFTVADLPYARPPRAAGTTKWRWRGLWRLALDGITASTTAPLRIWTYAGMLTALVAFGYGAFLVVRTMLLGSDVPGYASLMAAILFLGALNLISMGILGEYIGRIATEVRARPLYVIESKSGCEDGAHTLPRTTTEKDAWTAPPMRA